MDWIHQREPRVGAAALSSVTEAAGRGAARRGEEEGGDGSTGESRRGRGRTGEGGGGGCASQDSGVRRRRRKSWKRMGEGRGSLARVTRYLYLVFNLGWAEHLALGFF